VPTEEVVELKNGKKSVTERRFFPGYVLVEMEMDDDTWHLVKHTSKVTGFVGGARNRPAPISEAEVMKIVNQMQEGVDKPRPKVEWTVGELVRVKEGPFTDFNGASRKSTTRSPRCACRSPSSVVRRRSSSISRRSRKCDERSSSHFAAGPQGRRQSRSHSACAAAPAGRRPHQG
jgi:hypothetical protein